MNKDTFTEQVLAAEESLYHVAKSILHNDEDCADAIQNAILCAYSKLSALRNEKFFKTWLTRILINECYQMMRRRREQVPFEEYMGWNEEEAYFQQEMEGRSEVFEELMKLNEKYRIPMVLHTVEGYSVKEIAGILDISEQNVKNRLFRARQALRDKLKGVI